MKTAHQFAHELLAGQDLPIVFFSSLGEPDERLLIAPATRRQTLNDADGQDFEGLEIVEEIATYALGDDGTRPATDQP